MDAEPRTAERLSAMLVSQGGLCYREGLHVRHQTEWEREIATLDQREMELQQQQLRIVREEMTAVIRDVATLQSQVASLLANEESVDRSARKWAIGSTTFDQRLVACERQCVALGEGLHGGIASDCLKRDLETVREKEATMRDRLDAMERDLRESMQPIHARVPQLEELLKTDRAAAEERLNSIDTAMASSAAGSSEELAALRAQVEQLQGRLTEGLASQESHAKLIMANERDAWDSQYAFMQTALNDVQGALAAERTARERLEGVVHDLLQREVQARSAVEWLLGPERAECCRHRKATDERLDSLQNAVSFSEEFMRNTMHSMEKDGRLRETQRLRDSYESRLLHSTSEAPSKALTAAADVGQFSEPAAQARRLPSPCRLWEPVCDSPLGTGHGGTAALADGGSATAPSTPPQSSHSGWATATQGTPTFSPRP